MVSTENSVSGMMAGNRPGMVNEMVRRSFLKIANINTSKAVDQNELALEDIVVRSC